MKNRKRLFWIAVNSVASIFGIIDFLKNNISLTTNKQMWHYIQNNYPSIIGLLGLVSLIVLLIYWKVSDKIKSHENRIKELQDFTSYNYITNKIIQSTINSNRGLSHPEVSEIKKLLSESELKFYNTYIPKITAFQKQENKTKS